MKCDFCGKEVAKGKGMVFVFKNGKILNFCNSKCQKNFMKLKRSPSKTNWTIYAHKEKERLIKARMKKEQKVQTEKGSE
ncbi:50S ribosomal protein L24e [Candidatus Micrarchaeota archaeon]|jgi:large subunit ribosomal protein L24e|nr:50S ribosomal protein L24e [Candidatus Micrarchaeota archaeon]